MITEYAQSPKSKSTRPTRQTEAAHILRQSCFLNHESIDSLPDTSSAHLWIEMVLCTIVHHDASMTMLIDDEKTGELF